MASIKFVTTDLGKIRHHVPVTRMSLATWNADRFKRAYRAKGLTLQTLAVTSGIPYSAIRSYSARQGASPSPERLVLLAKTLKVPTTELAPLREKFTLHELRWHAGLTVEALAKKAGYSVSHTRVVLAGVSPITQPAHWAAALQASESDVARAWEAARAEQAAGSER